MVISMLQHKIIVLGGTAMEISESQVTAMPVISGDPQQSTLLRRYQTPAFFGTDKAQSTNEAVALPPFGQASKQRAALLSAPAAEEAAVTIIIPTSGRATLSRTLKSLQSQTNKNWRAILVLGAEHGPETPCLLADGAGAKPITLQSSAPAFFKGKLKQELQKDSRLSFAVLPFSGYDFFNNAGGQRNAVFHLVDTDWAAFVDDDDTLGEWAINRGSTVDSVYDDTLGERAINRGSTVDPVYDDTLGERAINRGSTVDPVYDNTLSEWAPSESSELDPHDY
jgi:hypothetical protein